MDKQREDIISLEDALTYAMAFEPIQVILEHCSDKIDSVIPLTDESKRQLLSYDITTLKKYSRSLKTKRKDYIFKDLVQSSKYNYSKLISVFDIYHAIFPRLSEEDLIEQTNRFCNFAYEYFSNVNDITFANLIRFEGQFKWAKTKHKASFDKNIYDLKNKQCPKINDDIQFSIFNQSIHNLYYHLSLNSPVNLFDKSQLESNYTYYIFLPKYLSLDEPVIMVHNSTIELIQLCDGKTSRQTILKKMEKRYNNTEISIKLNQLLDNYLEQGIIYECK